MTEYSRMAKGNFTATGTSQVITLPFQPDYVEVWNYTNIKTAADHAVTRAWWDAKLIDSSTNDNATMIELYSGSTTSVVFDTIQTNGITSINAALALQFGPTIGVTAITKATQAQVTTASAHGYNVGDTVIMQQIALASTNNMQLLNDVPFTIVSVPSTTTFTINWNTNQSNYTALTGQTVPLVKKVLYPFLYLPEDNVINAITLGATTTVATTMYHNFEVGQEIAFRVPTFWGTTQLNSLPNNVTPGSPIYGYVSSVTDNWTFVCTINSSSYTAYTTNGAMTASTLPGLTYAQVLSVGDVNSGGNVYGINGSTLLYPPPFFPTSTNRVASINGPAVRGSFVNNTYQGFLIGPGVAAVDGTATIMANGNQVYWHAYLHDYGNP